MSVQSTNYQCVASLPASRALPTLSSLSELKRDFPVCAQRHSHRFPQDRQVTSEEAFLVFQRSALIEKTSFSFIWLPPHLGGGKAALLALGLLGELAPGNQVLGGSGGHCNRLVILSIFFWHLCCCIQGRLHLLRCNMDDPHCWTGFRLRFVLFMERDKVLKQVWFGWSWRGLLTTGLYWVSRVSIWGSFFLSLCGRGPTWNTEFLQFDMRAHLIPSVSYRDGSWRHTWWRRWCCWRWSWWRQDRVHLFLSWRLGPSVSLGRGFQIVRVVRCLFVIRCVTLPWLLLDIK